MSAYTASGKLRRGKGKAATRQDCCPSQKVRARNDANATTALQLQNQRRRQCDAICKRPAAAEPAATQHSTYQTNDNAHNNAQDLCIMQYPWGHWMSQYTKSGKLRRVTKVVTRQSKQAPASGDANATTALQRPICKRPAAAEPAATKQKKAKEVAVPPAGAVQPAAKKQKRAKAVAVPAVAVQAGVCPLDFFSRCSMDIIATIMKNCYVSPQMQFNQIAVTNRRNNVGWRAMIIPIQVGMLEGFLLDIIPWVNNQLAEIDVPAMALHDLLDTMWSSSRCVSSRHTMTPSSSMIQIEDHVC
jgi:hypothetical protein